MWAKLREEALSKQVQPDLAAQRQLHLEFANAAAQSNVLIGVTPINAGHTIGVVAWVGDQ